jgi:hypothetical protein
VQCTVTWTGYHSRFASSQVLWEGGDEIVGVELTLDPSIRYQTLLGFGGAFTDAAGELRPRAYGTGAASRRCHPLSNFTWALVAPSLMLQVSLDPEPMGLELFQGAVIRCQTLLGFGGAFTGASQKLGQRSFRTGASSGSYSTL